MVDIFGPAVPQHTLTVTTATPGFTENTLEDYRERLGEEEPEGKKNKNTVYGMVTSSPAGVDAGGIDECFRACSAQFDPNKTVTLTATPIRHGAKFLGWSGAGGCDTEPTCVVNTGKPTRR